MTILGGLISWYTLIYDYHTSSYHIKNWKEKEQAVESFLNFLTKDCDEWSEIANKSN